jgi:hypothetical protein
MMDERFIPINKDEIDIYFRADRSAFDVRLGRLDGDDGRTFLTVRVFARARKSADVVDAIVLPAEDWKPAVQISPQQEMLGGRVRCHLNQFGVGHREANTLCGFEGDFAFSS